MVHKFCKCKLLFVLVSVSCFFKYSKADSALSDINWDDQSDELTEEIEKITQRPDVYKRTPPGLNQFTEITDPPEYYENEYADKPCQDRAEGKIMAAKNTSEKFHQKKSDPNLNDHLIQAKKDDPKVVLDTLKVSKVNGVYKMQQNIVTENLRDDENINEKDIGKQAAIGDNVIEQEKGNDNEQHIPIGDNLKESNNEEKPEGIIAKNEPQVNMEDIVNKVKEEVLDVNKKDPSDKISAIVKDLKNIPNVQSLYNVVSDKDAKIQNKVLETKSQVNTNQNNVGFDKLFEDLKGGIQNKAQDAAGLNKLVKNPSNDIQIKIKLERVDDAKKNLNNQVNNLMDLMRKPLSGVEQLQSMMNKMMPISLNGQNLLGSKVAQPQNFYMKYLQIDPDQHKLRYEYYFFQKYVKSRYNNGKQANLDGNQPSVDAMKPLFGQPSSSVLISKLISQMLSPMSSMSLLTNPIVAFLNPQVSYRRPQQDKKLPVRIFINEKSVAKYKRSLDMMEKNGRGKREVTETTTEMPLFNEGPFKVEDPKHLEWARDFLKGFPKEERPSSMKIIHQQPSSTDVLQWYHPFKGEEWTYYTVEPTVTRTLGPEEPKDLCDCHNH